MKQKLNNLLYRLFKKPFLNLSYIHDCATIGKNNFIQNAEIYNNVTTEENVKVVMATINGNVHIGRYTSIWGPSIYILSEKHPITIGNFCSIASKVSIQEYGHNYQKMTSYYIGRNLWGDRAIDDVPSKGPITIGHDVWIGTGAVILSGVTIGNGAVIGANSIVNNDVPPFAIVAGNPSKIIKYRFTPETIQRIDNLGWYFWDKSTIQKNKHLFKETLT